MRVRNQPYERTLPILGGILVSIGLLLACSETTSGVSTPAATITVPLPMDTFIPNSTIDLSLNCITQAFGPAETSTDEIMLLIDEVHACRCNPAGTPVTQNQGYIYVIVSVRVVNRHNTIVVDPSNIVLLDEFENTFRKCNRENCFNLEPVSFVAPQTSTRGKLVYPVPLPSAQDELWIQWKQDSHSMKVEIIQPLEGTGWSE